MRNKSFVVAIGVTVFTVLLAIPAFAQTIFGTILGTVTDQSGAVVPNIVVTVTNQGENISREVRSDAQGNYQAENMRRAILTARNVDFRWKSSFDRDFVLESLQTRSAMRVGATELTHKYFSRARFPIYLDLGEEFGGH